MGQYKSPDFGGLIGLERIKQIISLLRLHDRTNVLIVGILGMDGMGKTTLAHAIFNNYSNQFQGVCFIQNVGERLENFGGLASLRKEILSKVFKDEKLELDGPIIPQKIEERLNHTRVFIVLDDVDHFLPIEFLARFVDGLGKGSRVLITSRDRQVLWNCHVNNDSIYEVKGFNPHEARQLFHSYAFKGSPPTEDFKALSEKIVDHAKGNPLAIKMLGSVLYKKTKQEWESAVNKLLTNLGREIFDVLKISFDGLDHQEKKIFLDIACFLKGEDREYVAKVLDDCDYSLSVLIDKSLITISRDKSIQMHDLLQKMGWKIVHDESPEELGKRSRLWRQEDVVDTLKRDDGTEAVQGIVLDMSKIKDMHLSPQAFTKMYNLRLLKFYNPTWIKEYCLDFNSSHLPYHSKVHFGECLSYLSDKLRSLIWHGYPLHALPTNFNPYKLVELDLRRSIVESLWEDSMHVPNLKRLFLIDCARLTKIPDLSESPRIEIIDIRNCSSLLDFPPLAQRVKNFCVLYMWGCKSLRSFPGDIHFESLEFLDLHDCNNITKFPEISGNIKHLDLSGAAIDEVPRSIQCLTKLCNLNLSHCTRLQLIPTSIWKLKSLYELNLEKCSRLESLPKFLDTAECLETLKLSGTAIKELPENLGDLKSLRYLSADRTAISQLPSSLKHLKNLEKLSCRGCRGLRFAHSSGLPCSLTSLCLSDCNLKEIPEDICRLSSLSHLDLSENHFECLPKSMKQLCDLEDLYLNNCNMLQSLTELPSRLQHLSASDCELLQSIPDASEFEKIIRNEFSEFIFTNCLNLEAAVGNMLALLITYLNKKSGRYSFCYSGSKVPEWFIYRTEGSSIKFGVPEWHEYFSGQLLGFAVCAVIAFEKYCYNGESEDQSGFKYNFGEEDFRDQLEISYRFIINNKVCNTGDIVVACKNKTLIDSDHVAFMFLPRSLWKLPSGFTNCSFEFSPSKECPNFRVKYCGVRLIYANKDIGETSGRRSLTSNDRQEEEMELHSKRLKP